MAKKRSTPFIIAFGGENFLLDRALELGKSWADRQISVLDGEDISDDELVSECESRSFDGRDRVVVLDNAQAIKSTKALKVYVEQKDPQDDSTILVAVVRANSLPDVWEAAGKKGTVYLHEKYKPWKTAEITKRIVAEAKNLKLTLDEDVPALFLKVLGDNLRQTVNELRKLAHLVGEGEKVTKEHVSLVIAPVIPVEPYQVAEAAVAKNPRKAMNCLSLLYKNLGEGVSVPITGALMRQVERLLVAKQMVEKGDSVEVIAIRLNMPPYVCKTQTLPLLQKHTVATLRSQMKTLCRLDSLVKGPARSKRTHVELAVLSIAA
jgi:DNA polymerase III subunit delta